MNKLAVFFMFLFVSMSVLSFTMEREPALAATTLSATLTPTATTMHVANAVPFAASDVLYVDSEVICYSGQTLTTFTGLVRGCQDTEATAHTAGVSVYNETTGIINQQVGFNIAETQSTMGKFKTVVSMPLTLAKTFAKIVLWDFSYLTGDLVYIKYMVLYPLSAGLVFSLITLTIGGFRGVFNS
jgi:hypothetical protein